MKKKWLIVIGSVFLMILIAACGSGEKNTATSGSQSGESSLINVGKETYAKSCLHCHGNDLKGKSGPALDNMNLTKQQIIDIIENGQGTMPGGLAKGKEEAIAEYLLSLQSK